MSDATGWVLAVLALIAVAVVVAVVRRDRAYRLERAWHDDRFEVKSTGGYRLHREPWRERDDDTP